jgi:hypothetical protein
MAIMSDLSSEYFQDQNRPLVRKIGQYRKNSMPHPWPEPAAQDLDLFSYSVRIVDLDAQMAGGALVLGVAQ